jgi:phosphatidylglycerol:prolipoprotein diacylglycerol transferase
MRSVIFSIGPFTVYGYGLMIAIGILAAYLVAVKRAKKYGLNADLIFDLAIWCLVGGLLGAKILYWVTILPSILADPAMIFHDFSNGFVVYGGIIGGILCGYLFCRRKKVIFRQYFDLVMPSVALAQGFGRIGCFLAGCCYGAETDSCFHVIFRESALAPNNVPLIPTQLISSALDFAHFFVLCWFASRKKADGQVAGLYLILYSIGRFILEFFRGDLIRGSVGTLSTSQFISIFILIAGLIVFFGLGALNRKKKA